MWKLSLGTCLFILSHNWNQLCLTKKGYFFTEHGLSLPFSKGLNYNQFSFGRKTSVVESATVTILDCEIKFCLNVVHNAYQNVIIVFVNWGLSDPRNLLKMEGSTVDVLVKRVSERNAGIGSLMSQQEKNKTKHTCAHTHTHARAHTQTKKPIN